MKTPITRLAVLFAAAVSALEGHAVAATCTIPGDLPDQGDAFYMSGWGCGQIFINDMWSRFSMSQDDWDSGFGYEEPCNNIRPLARTFNALQLLAYSHTGSPTCDTGAANLLDWAYCWAGNQIDELDGRCGSGVPAPGSRAHTEWGPFIDNYTDVYFPFFYGEDVVQRASTIFHEARHASWCGHNDGGCPRGASCDNSFNDGCSKWGAGQGANAFQVRFLEWFAVTANWTTAAMKSSAIAEANDILGRAFNTDPCFRLDSNGFEFTTC